MKQFVSDLENEYKPSHLDRRHLVVGSVDGIMIICKRLEACHGD